MAIMRSRQSNKLKKILHSTALTHIKSIQNSHAIAHFKSELVLFGRQFLSILGMTSFPSHDTSFLKILFLPEWRYSKDFNQHLIIHNRKIQKVIQLQHSILSTQKMSWKTLLHPPPPLSVIKGYLDKKRWFYFNFC